MTDAVFLKTYRSAKQELAVVERQLALSGTTGQPAGMIGVKEAGMSRGTNNATAAAIQRMDGLVEQADAIRRRLAEMDLRFSALMAAAWGYRERCILRQYYQLGQTDAQVAECLGVSVRHANRLRSDLLRRLDGLNVSRPQCPPMSLHVHQKGDNMAL